MIEFYNRETGKVACNKYDTYFVRGDGKVYCDNMASYESQCCVVSFESFVMQCQELAWREVANAEITGADKRPVD